MQVGEAGTESQIFVCFTYKRCAAKPPIIPLNEHSLTVQRYNMLFPALGHTYAHRWPNLRRHQLRVGLQSKSVLMLSFIVVVVMAIGGCLYYHTASSLLRARDRDNARQLSYALEASARAYLRTGQAGQLQELAEDFVWQQGVDHVVLLDADGVMCGKASRYSDPMSWDGLARWPTSVYSIQQVSSSALTVARPVVDETESAGGHLLGAARLVVNTAATSQALAGLRRRILLIGAVVVVSTMPLAYLLVWRLLVAPIQRLVAVTRRLAGGDFDSRSGIHGNDEIGHLAYTFDVMAEDISAMRQELLSVNETLENTVARRTDELQMANTRLREEMLEKEDFLRAVSHDLNAPLRNIDGMTSMVLKNWRNGLPEDVVTRLDRIQANVKMETELISDLLDLSRAWAESRERSHVDVREMIAELLGAFDHELQEHGIVVTVSGDMPTLFVERNRLRQVFQNLIDNAIKYMDKPTGRIDISVLQEDGMHKFVVRDNGPGIPADQLQKVFYVFRRAESAATASVKGRGVGLALVKAVAAKYGGRAYVESELGVGSVFHVELSIAATSEQERRTSETLVQ